MEIQFIKDWRPTYWGIGLGFMLTAGILSIYFWMKNYFTSYTVEETTITKRHGIIFKKFETVDLYQIKNVSATDDIFKGGNIYITMTDHRQYHFGYLRNAEQLTHQIRTYAHKARAGQGVAPLEVM